MIGEKIKSTRKKRGLTQVELGCKIGVTGATVTRYEKGTIIPNYEMVKNIADKLKIPITELLSDEQLQSKKFNAANKGLITILESIYDIVDFQWHEEGEFDVYLKKDAEEYNLTKQTWQILFNFICANIPVFINMIKDNEN